MDQQETFNWLVERSRRLTEVERELEELRVRHAETCLELAHYHVKPIVDAELEAERRTKALQL